MLQSSPKIAFDTTRDTQNDMMSVINDDVLVYEN
jgi:hypothetical protein